MREWDCLYLNTLKPGGQMPLVKTVPSQPEDPARRQQAAPRYPLEINWTGGDAGEFSQHREQRPSRLESVRVALTKPGTTTGN